jgi:hypothetical protein
LGQELPQAQRNEGRRIHEEVYGETPIQRTVNLAVMILQHTVQEVLFKCLFYLALVKLLTVLSRGFKLLLLHGENGIFIYKCLTG